jgi:hypothetical protein
MRRANAAARPCSAGEASVAKRNRRWKRTTRSTINPAQTAEPAAQSSVATVGSQTTSAWFVNRLETGGEAIGSGEISPTRGFAKTGSVSTGVESMRSFGGNVL